MLHATLSASGAERWINCPGSIRLSVGMPRKDTVYSATGTVAHAVAAECLTKGMDNAAILLGKIYSEGGFSIEVDEAMVEGVQLYLDYVRQTRAQLPLATLDIERKFKLDWLHEGLWGTNDACIGQPYGDLVVLDYKNGSGHMVSPEDNAQLKYYGVGRIGKDNEECFNRVTLVIVQPHAKGEKIKTWSTTTDSLIAWSKGELLASAHAALEENAPTHSGEWCKFCPGMAVCPEKRKEVCQVAAVAFKEADLAPIPPTLHLPPVDTLTKEQLARVLDLSESMSEYFDQVKAHVRTQLENGVDGYRYKLVEGRSSPRKWATEDEAERQMVARYKAKAYKQSLLTPTQMEKVIKEFGDDPKTVLAPLVAEQTKSIVLVPEDDKRPSIRGRSLMEVFGHNQ